MEDVDPADRGHFGKEVAIRAEHQARDVRLNLHQLIEECDAVHRRHAPVGDHQIELAFARPRQRGFGLVEGFDEHGIAEGMRRHAVDRTAQAAEHVAFVVYQQDLGHCWLLAVEGLGLRHGRRADAGKLSIGRPARYTCEYIELGDDCKSA